MSKRSRRRRFDYLTPALALVVAFIFWLIGAISLKKTDSFEVPVDVILPKDYIIMESADSGAQPGGKGKKTTVTLRSSETVLNELRSEIGGGFKVVVKYEPKPNESKCKLLLDKTCLSVPEELWGSFSVEKIDPKEIDIEFNRIVSKSVPVKVELTGSVEIGYRLIDKFATPKTVTVSGPSKFLDRLAVVPTQPRSISGLTAGTILEQVLIAEKFPLSIDNVMQDVEIKCKETVNVTVLVEREETTREIECLKIGVLLPNGFPMAAEVRERSVKFSLKGPKIELDRLDPANLKAYVDLSSLTIKNLPPGVTQPLLKEPVYIILPPGISLDEKVPRPQVTLQLKRPQEDLEIP
ncbi:MAG TPA: CdaR family protein [Candidatus Brocadiia bacterium]|nr:CdaR family protein [Candidatus Brocadiia bacterium]